MPGSCAQAKVIRRTWTARDACGNPASAVQTITVVDTTPPMFTYVPGDMDLGCNPPDTSPDATGRAEAKDNCDPNPVVTYTDQILQEGCRVTIVRTWTARDACGNLMQRVQRITYTADTVPPVLTLPPDVNLGCHCSRPDISPDATGWAQATDNCDPQPTITYSDAESVDGEFHTVTRTWMATDACGNRSQGVQRILFRIDQTPPILVLPPNRDLGCHCTPPDTSPNSTGWAQATDNCDPAPQISYADEERVDGEWHTIVRTWRATDRCGLESSGTQQIVFRIDQTPPSLNCPTGVTAYLFGCRASSVWVDFPILVTDNCDPSPQAWCTPPGGWFSEGTTWVTVEYGARDRCGNEVFRTCTFPVTVIRENRPPVARDDSPDCHGTCNISVLANDYDPDDDPISIFKVSQPQCGTIWWSGNTVYYTTAGWSCPTPPGPGVTDSFTYTITDGCGYDMATVIVHITCEICPLALPPGGKP